MTTFATLLTLATVALVFALFKMSTQMSENNSSLKPIRVETEEEQQKRYRNRR